MANFKAIKVQTQDTINAALTIINNFPDLENMGASMSYDASANPFNMVLNLLKSIGGYDYIIHLISSFIATSLPVVEMSVKTVLITNLTNLINCSLNPYISNDDLINGMEFDLRRLDLMRILNYSPLDTEFKNLINFKGKNWFKSALTNISSVNHNPGKYYYFGCGNASIPDDLDNAGDFNAYLWFIKNRATYRCVWNGVNIFQALFVDSSYKKNDGNEKYNYYTQKPLAIPQQKTDGKFVKNSGIVTLEYNENYGTFPPNKLKVFIGNATLAKPLAYTKSDPPQPITIDGIKKEVKEKSHTKLEKEKTLIDLTNKKMDLQTQVNTLEERYKQDLNVENADEETITNKYKEDKGNLSNQIKEVDEQIDAVKDEIKDLETQIILDLAKLTNAEYIPYQANCDTKDCCDVKNNYYYHKTWIKFNFDFVMSMKLFDAKVVTAQLIDALTGCLSIDLHASFEQLFVQNEVKKMVKAVVETDDAVVSDCFFAFTNEEFDRLLNKSEMIRNGLFTVDGEENTNRQIDASQILNNINNIDDSASKEEILSVVEGGLYEISKTLSSTEDSSSINANFGVQMNFVENLLTTLSTVLVQVLLSPKVYLLIAMNLKNLGGDPLMDISEVIRRFKKLYVEVIRKLRDMLLKYITDALMKLVNDLAKQIGVQFIIEQTDYYQKLIRKLIQCFKLKNSGDGVGFQIDDVDYADIYEQASETPEVVC